MGVLPQQEDAAVLGPELGCREGVRPAQEEQEGMLEGLLDDAV